MIYLGMNFFEFILFQPHWVCWIYKFVFCQIWGAFSHFFSHFSSNIFSCITLFLISFRNSSGTNVRPFDIISQDLEALFIFLKLFFSLCWSEGIISIHVTFIFKFTDSLLCHIHCASEYLQWIFSNFWLLYFSVIKFQFGSFL